MALLSPGNALSGADASSTPRSTPSPGVSAAVPALATLLPPVAMRPTKIISSGFVSSSKRLRPRPPVHCCVRNATVVVPFALASLIRSSNCDNTVHPKRSPAAAPASPNWLGKMQRVKYRIGCGLRQALHAQVAVRSDLADDVTRFIDGRNQQALRRAAPKGNPKVTDIIGLG